MTQTAQQLYAQLTAHLEKVRSIESAMQLCEWDQETYMPPKGIFFRSLTLSNLGEITHKLKTSPAYKKLLGNLIDLNSGVIKHHDLSHQEKANLQILKSDLEKQIKIPSKFVKNFTQLTSEATFVWQKAKEHSDFRSFAPYLKKIVLANQKKAKLLGFKDHPYNALVDLYEPGMNVATLDTLFTKLKFELIQLLKQIKAKNKHLPPLDLKASVDDQMNLGKALLEAMGLCDEVSRLDLTAHPFCASLGPCDIRLTTRIIEDDYLSNIYSTLHEGGHGLYALGLSTFNPGLPEGHSASYGLDESQSRLYETRLGKSKGFIEAITPLIQKHLHLPHLSSTTLYDTINQVKPHLIRIESDEVSYTLHIILRYELEKALIEGSLDVEDLPKAWNEKMESYLGLLPAHDCQGCLQDIHWAMGSMGYFPTYALGNIYAASLYQAFLKTHPQFEQELKTLNLSSIKTFMQTHLYAYGRLKQPLELMKQATQEGLNPEVYLNYLKDKFS